MFNKAINIEDMVFYRWLANHQALVLIGDEAFRYQTAIQRAAKRLNTERQQTVKVVIHDKFAGFYEATPSMIQPDPKLKTNLPVNALQYMSLDWHGINRVNPQLSGDDLPFKPEENVIFVLKDWEGAISENPMVVQGIRNYIQSNMGSGNFFYNDKTDRTTRGRRLLVFIMAQDKLQSNLPELKPHVVPLPDTPVLAEAVENVLSPFIAANKKNKEAGFPDPGKQVRQQLVNALQGSTYQFAEDVLSFALAKHRGIKDVPALLKTIEDEKATYIAGIPGLTYISKDRVTPIEELPGYEAVAEFARDRTNIDPEEAALHRIQPFRGITLAGAPGVGKTQVGMAIASVTNRMLLIWNLGESQSQWVGESEAQTRRAIQIAQAMAATMLLDDMDKAGVDISGGNGQSHVSSGSFSRMIQALLTEMSSNENRAQWIFTCNRITGLPPELIRPGRMDERFFVERPDSETRERIFRVHCTKRNYPVDDSMVGLLSDNEITDGWTGAECEQLVKDAAILATKEKAKKLDWKWMIKRAKGITPMIKQPAYSEDIKKMEEFCETWTKVGRIPRDEQEKETVGSGRAKRSTEI